MKWDKEEIELLKLWLSLGWTYKEIANEWDLTEGTLRSRASKLGIRSLKSKKKTTEQYKAEIPKDVEVLEEYRGAHIKILHKHQICGLEWNITPTNILRGKSCPKCATNALKTTEAYKAELPENIEVLEKYKGNKTKILHKHKTCGHEWSAVPASILNGHSCPNCAKGGFKPNEAGILYLIYFYALGLYKIGITNRTVKERFRSEPQPYEVVLERYFENGKDAMKLEKYWLSNVDLYNSGELKAGNTETFTYGY